MINSLYKRGAWLLGYRGVPFAVRGIFRFEAMHMTVWGVAWGCLNAKFCMYVARRSLDAPTSAVSLIAASTALANILAIWWGSLATRFERKRRQDSQRVGRWQFGGHGPYLEAEGM